MPSDCEKADHDFVAARATLATGKALDMVCFHAQQAAEKSLKALLALKDIEFPWRHDLAELLEMVRAHYPDIALPAEDLVSLTPYAVEARYVEAWAPEQPETLRALRAAEQVYDLAARTITAAPEPGCESGTPIDDNPAAG